MQQRRLRKHSETLEATGRSEQLRLGHHSRAGLHGVLKVGYQVSVIAVGPK